MSTKKEDDAVAHRLLWDQIAWTALWLIAVLLWGAAFWALLGGPR